jgi:hypothetical protein
MLILAMLQEMERKSIIEKINKFYIWQEVTYYNEKDWKISEKTNNYIIIVHKDDPWRSINISTSDYKELYNINRQ